MKFLTNGLKLEVHFSEGKPQWSIYTEQNPWQAQTGGTVCMQQNIILFCKNGEWKRFQFYCKLRLKLATI